MKFKGKSCTWEGPDSGISTCGKPAARKQLEEKGLSDHQSAVCPCGTPEVLCWFWTLQYKRDVESDQKGATKMNKGLLHSLYEERLSELGLLNLEKLLRLQRFFEIFFKNRSSQQAFNNMKEAISKLLLVTEVFSESSASGPSSFNQCSQCFQMLTFDIGFGISIYPVILEVHGNFDFQDEDELTIQDQTFKEFLLEDTFKFLLYNGSSTSSFIEALQKIHGSTLSKDGTYHREDEQCFSLEEIHSMITFIKELKSLGQFELLFPSAAPKIQTLVRDLYHMVDPMRRLGSVLTLHWLLSSLLEQFQFMTKEAHTNLSECFDEFVYQNTFPEFLQLRPDCSVDLFNSSYLTMRNCLRKYHGLDYGTEEGNIKDMCIGSLTYNGKNERQREEERQLGLNYRNYITVAAVNPLASLFAESKRFLKDRFMVNEICLLLIDRQSSQENMSPKWNVPSDFRKNHEDKDTLSHIRQIFTSPQLELNPQFNPKIKEYYAEVPFDMVTVKIGAEPSNCQCQVHLDDKKGPSTAKYPLGLGLNKVIIFVTDDSQPSPRVVSSYRITVYREDRPSLPLFDDYMMCGFVQ
ncbi:PREDICTED: cadherin-like and PC-esterase domain-containing protein 1, partial [Acanthisitta chloris]|uniref:cadherin-like and PC-esterase domain-containing protein 1 n=1 Tax=Acanthisitta chloris TaxID=57068 RepID=UPI0004F0ECFC